MKPSTYYSDYEEVKKTKKNVWENLYSHDFPSVSISSS